MAEVGLRSPQHGYPRGVFTGEYDSKLICNKCNNILREPVQSYCGHRFCKVCIDEVISSGQQNQCQSCIQEGVEDETFSILRKEQLFPDNALRREMNSMEARCTNSGCGWTGKFKLYEDHIKDCKHKPVACTQCGKLTDISNMRMHLEMECPNRSVNCKYCHEDVLFAKQQEHDNTCPKHPVKCDLCGKKKLTRETLQLHLQNDCINYKLSCPAGCDPVERQRFHSHVEQKAGFHIQWLLSAIVQLQQEVEKKMSPLSPSGGISEIHQTISALENKVTQQEQMIRQTVSGSTGMGSPGTGTELDGIKLRLQGTELKTSTFEGIVTTLHKEIERCIRLFEEMERKGREEQNAAQAALTKINYLERQIGLKDVIIAELSQKVKDLDDVIYDGDMTWRIDNWKKVLQDAVSGTKTSIYSPPFYSHRTGYKMCLRFYPNGDGMGKGTHTSIFFCIMRGKYDALLSWPFRHRITFMILDQKGSNHKMDSFRPDSGSSSFRKPISDMNIASGCPLFITQGELKSQKYNYVLEDTLFLRTIVDMQERRNEQTFQGVRPP